tara:strand:+ start:194 stop:367 length:174 start_codon:yes stop_codon:yes gene_type:complete
MRTITIYREDMNSTLHGNLFDSLLEQLGIATHTEIAGRLIDNEIDEVTISVTHATTN